MFNLWRDMKPGPNPPKNVYAVVEIPKGSRNKYELHKESGHFKLDRVLYSPFVYATEYGLIPQTLWDDGDPMDILVLMDQPTFPGCIIEARPIGLLEMIDSGDSDVKVLAVPVDDPRYNDVTELNHVYGHILRELEHFFAEYKTLQGKKVEILGWKGREEAEKAIERAIKLYKEKYG